MKWLTRSQVKKEARKSAKAALNCSIKHWEQICSATKAECKEADEQGILFGCFICGLCVRYIDCDICPLHEEGLSCAGGQYGKVYGAYYEYKSFSVFKKETRKLLKILQGVKK